ncbi:helix-turn-helix transcriptional regulator [Martelella mediterranea]|uniref:HTH luxR-type domain-containing protein n=1 Tax=Martelella mediterranea DSM 17316 TaxID=1122214 RepID=A0A1U9Z405_9HYPH|nr:helix-turn-helix transcriptional regulator [Martelella mediterranea]AQZ52408.1 hypothetical protein Mame_03092 [Martelella mediterranea DSM 17316]
MDIELFSRILQGLYSPSTSQFDENSMISDEIARFSGVSGMTILKYNGRQHQYQLQESSRIYRKETDTFSGLSAKYGAFELRALRRLLRQQQYIPMTDAEMWPDEPGLLETEMFVETSKIFGVGRRFAVNMSGASDWNSGFVMHVDHRKTDISPESLRAASLIAPHLASALALEQMNNVLRKQYAVMLELLDSMDIGVCIVSQNGDVIIENRKASAVFADQDGISKKDGKIVAYPQASNGELRRRITQTALTAIGQANLPRNAMVITKRSLRSPYWIEISPFGHAGNDLEKNFRGALIRIVDSDRKPKFKVKPFAKMVGLTSAEIEIGQLICSGYSASDIADIRGVSIHTARSQIKSILAKSGCSNRVLFVAKVASLSQF